MEAPMYNNCQTAEKRYSQGSDGIDPRVQVELEKLNRASEEINSLELQLQAGRNTFRLLLAETTRTLNDLGQKLGKCVDKARPYYEARVKAREVQVQAQTAVLRFERACSMLAAAKEMVHLAELGYVSQGQPFDPAWQEMLNHATGKVNEAEVEKLSREHEHEAWAKAFVESDKLVKKLQKEYKRSILKSKPYFEAKAKANQQLQEQKAYIEDVERGLIKAKQIYRDTLTELEMISEDIHERRTRSRNARAEVLKREEVWDGSESGRPAESLEGQSNTAFFDSAEMRAGASVAVVKDSSSMDTGYLSDPACGDSRGVLSSPAAAAALVFSNGEGVEAEVLDGVQSTRNGPLRSIPVTFHPLSQSLSMANISVSATAVVYAEHVEMDATCQSPADDFGLSPSSPVDGNNLLGAASLYPTALSTSPSASPSILIFPSPSSESSNNSSRLPNDASAADAQTMETNAAVMASIQKLKGFARSLLRSKPGSRASDAASEASCDSAMASISMVGDEIIDNLTIEPEDYALFLAAANAATGQQRQFADDSRASF